MRPGSVFAQRVKLCGSIERLFLLCLCKCVCVHVCLLNRWQLSYVVSPPSEMEKAKATLVECLLLEVSNSGSYVAMMVM